MRGGRAGWTVAGGVAVAAVVVLTALVVRGMGVERADREADEAMFVLLQTDPVLDVHPPGARHEGDAHAVAPCDGDSGDGLFVTTGGATDASTEEVFAFYRAELVRLGWRDVELTSTGGVAPVDEVVGTRSSDGYDVHASVRSTADDPFARGATSYSVHLWAVPRQDCWAPFGGL